MAEDTPNLGYLALLLTPPNRPQRVHRETVISIAKGSKLLFLERTLFEALLAELCNHQIHRRTDDKPVLDSSVERLLTLNRRLG